MSVSLLNRHVVGSSKVWAGNRPTITRVRNHALVVASFDAPEGETRTERLERLARWRRARGQGMNANSSYRRDVRAGGIKAWDEDFMNTTGVLD